MEEAANLQLPYNKTRPLLHKYNRIMHHLRCCPNIVNCDCEHFQLEKHSVLPYFSSKPLYYCIEDRPCPKKDRALELVLRKYQYWRKLVILQTRYKSDKKKKVYRDMDREGFASHIVLKCIKHLETDPDEHFIGDYNWYYTGGCLDTAEIGGRRYVFHVIGENMDTLEISCFDATRATCQLKFKEPVHEVSYDRELVVVRCKSSAFLYKFHERKLELELILRCKEKSPFVAAKIFRGSQLVCLGVDHSLSVVASNTSTTRKEICLKEYFKEEKEKWAHLTILWNRYCVVVNRSRLIIVNLKTSAIVQVINIRRLRLVSSCSVITGVWESKLEDDLIFLATTHEIFAVKLFLGNLERDDEEIGEHSGTPFKVCIRWTHQLKHAPMILRSILLNDNGVKREMIFISSMFANNTKIMVMEKSPCSSDGDPGERPLVGYHSFYPPFTPIGMESAFESCCQLGLFPETKFNLHRRITLTTIGLGMFPQGISPSGSVIVNLLIMNSLGDIFHQTLARDRPDEEHYLAEMERVKGQLMEKEREGLRMLTITGYENLSGLFEAAIDYDPQEGGSGEGDGPKGAIPKARKRKYKWDRTMGRLRQYKDVLSQDMLAIWDLSDDDEGGEDEEKSIFHSRRDLEPEDKVSYWLQSVVGQTSTQAAGSYLTDSPSQPMADLDDSKPLLDQSLFKEESLTSSQEQQQQHRRRSLLSSSRAAKRKSRLSGF